MTDSKVIQLNSPVEDPLNAVLKRGATQLLAKAVEAELAELLAQYSALEVDGKLAVVRCSQWLTRTNNTNGAWRDSWKSSESSGSFRTR